MKTSIINQIKQKSILILKDIVKATINQETYNNYKIRFNKLFYLQQKQIIMDNLHKSIPSSSSKPKTLISLEHRDSVENQLAPPNIDYETFKKKMMVIKGTTYEFQTKKESNFVSSQMASQAKDPKVINADIANVSDYESFRKDVATVRTNMNTGAQSTQRNQRSSINSTTQVPSSDVQSTKRFGTKSQYNKSSIQYQQSILVGNQSLNDSAKSSGTISANDQKQTIEQNELEISSVIKKFPAKQKIFEMGQFCNVALNTAISDYGSKRVSTSQMARRRSSQNDLKGAFGEQPKYENAESFEKGQRPGATQSKNSQALNINIQLPQCNDSPSPDKAKSEKNGTTLTKSPRNRSLTNLARSRELSMASSKLKLHKEQSRSQFNKTSAAMLTTFPKLQIDRQVDLLKPKINQMQRKIGTAEQSSRDIKSSFLTSALNQQQIIKNLKMQQRRKQHNNTVTSMLGGQLLEQNVQKSVKDYVVDTMNSRPNISVRQLPSNAANQGFNGFMNPRSKDESVLPPESLYGQMAMISQRSREKADDTPAEGKFVLKTDQELYKLKTMDAKHLDMKTVEKWINETLKEAKFYEIKPAVKLTRNTANGPMQDYGIDRMTLVYSGIPQAYIDQLYRAYFINTSGFFCTIKDIIKQFTNNITACKDECHSQSHAHQPGNSVIKHKTKGSILSALWRVYSVLMEYAHRNDQQNQIMDVIEEGRRMLTEKEEQFQKLLDNAEKKIDSLEEYVEDIEEKYQSTIAAMRESQRKLEKSQQEMVAIRQTNEVEVNLRMKFEERMNYLHALNRSFKGVSETSKQYCSVKDQEMDVIKEELNKFMADLQNEKAQHDRQIQHSIIAEEKIDSKMQQLEIRDSMFENLNKGYKKLKDQSLEQNKQIIEKDKIIERFTVQVKEIKDTNKSNAKMARSLDKLKVELQLKINEQESLIRRLNEQYKNKDRLYNNCCGTITSLNFRNRIMEETKRIAVDRQEKAESNVQLRDIEIDKLQNTNEIKEVKFNQLKQAYEDQMSKIKHIDDLNYGLNVEDERKQRIIEELKIQNNQLEIAMANARENIGKLEENVSRLTEDLNEMTIKYNAKCAESAATIRQKDDQLSILDQQRLRQKRDILEHLYDLEKERSKDIKNQQTLLSNRQQITLQSTRIEFLEIDLQNKKEEIEILNSRKISLIDENDTNIQIGDHLKRNLSDLEKSSQFDKEKGIRELKKLIIENMVLTKQFEDSQMVSEDYRSQVAVREAKLSTQAFHIEYLENKRQEMEKSSKDLAAELQKVNEERDRLQSTYTELEDHHTKLEAKFKKVDQKNSKLEIKIEKVKKEHKDMKEQKSWLENEIAQTNAELEEALIKIRVLQTPPETRHFSTQKTIEYDPYVMPAINNDPEVSSQGSCEFKKTIQEEVEEQAAELQEMELVTVQENSGIKKSATVDLDAENGVKIDENKVASPQRSIEFSNSQLTARNDKNSKFLKQSPQRGTESAGSQSSATKRKAQENQIKAELDKEIKQEFTMKLPITPKRAASESPAAASRTRAGFGKSQASPRSKPSENKVQQDEKDQCSQCSHQDSQQQTKGSKQQNTQDPSNNNEENQSSTIQFPYIHRFQDTSSQCNILTQKKVINQFKDRYTEQLRKTLTTQLTESLTVEITSKVEKECQEKLESQLQEKTAELRKELSEERKREKRDDYKSEQLNTNQSSRDDYNENMKTKEKRDADTGTISSMNENASTTSPLHLAASNIQTIHKIADSPSSQYAKAQLNANSSNHQMSLTQLAVQQPASDAGSLVNPFSQIVKSQYYNQGEMSDGDMENPLDSNLVIDQWQSGLNEDSREAKKDGTLYSSIWNLNEYKQAFESFGEGHRGKKRLQTQDNQYSGNKKRVSIKNKNDALLAAGNMKKISLDMRDFSQMVMQSKYEQGHDASPIRPNAKSMLSMKYPCRSNHSNYPSTSRFKKHEQDLTLPGPRTQQRKRGSTSMAFSSGQLGATGPLLLSNIMIRGHHTNMYDDLMIAKFPDNQHLKPGKLGTRQDIRPLLKGAYSRI